MSSVTVPNRKHGKLEVNVLAADLIVYTDHITSNPKWFPLEKKAFIDELNGCALKIGAICWEANEIKVEGNMARFEHRERLQDEAASLCNRMCFLIEVAKPLFHLKSKRVTYWKKKVTTLRTIIRNWRLENMKRLNPAENSSEPDNEIQEKNAVPQA